MEEISVEAGRISKNKGTTLEYGFRVVRTGMLKGILDIFSKYGYSVIRIDDRDLDHEYTDLDLWLNNISNKKPKVYITVGRSGGMSNDFGINIRGTNLSILEQYPNADKKIILNEVDVYLKPLRNAISTLYHRSTGNMIVTTYALCFVPIVLFLFIKSIVWGIIAIALPVIVIFYTAFIILTNKLVKTDRDSNIFYSEENRVKLIFWILSAILSIVMGILGYIIRGLVE